MNQDRLHRYMVFMMSACGSMAASLYGDTAQRYLII